MKRAFTLIELLVVIAIIAILAAILFPVFAQAKTAAKKIADLSNKKQSGTAFAMYCNDSDDNYPLGYRWIPSSGTDGSWGWNYSVSTPLGWMGPSFAQGVAARMAQDASHWSNTVQPYMKNYGLYQGPGLSSYDVYGDPQSGNPGQIAPPALSNMTYNGLLHDWNATAIAAPSQLPLLWAGQGNVNKIGNSLTVPALYCPSPISTGGQCLYHPGAGAQTGTSPGGYTFTFPTSTTSVWCYGQGQNWTFCDTSAKFRTMGTGTNGNGYKTDPFTGYGANGDAPTSFWYDGYYPWLFRPDYDFSK